MRLVTRVLSTEPKLMADAEAFAAKFRDRPYPEPAPPPRALRRVAEVTTEQVHGRTVFTVRPRLARPPGHPEWHIVYLHGGGYVDELFAVHWDIVLQLLRHTGATITVPLYPLAPEHEHREGNAYVESVYAHLLQTVPAERIVLCGDSAGGGMCLAQAMRYRDHGLPLPARLVLFAPCTSVVPINPDVDEIEPRDVILARPGGALAGIWWAGEDSTEDPDVSPLYGDPSGLPPVDMFVGTADILWPDARIMADRLVAAGGEAAIYEYPDAIHVFVGATFTPEAQDAYRRVAASLGTTAYAGEPALRAVAAPVVVFPQQAALRLRDRSTPWIRHLGARAHLHLPRAGGRLQHLVVRRPFGRIPTKGTPAATLAT